MDKPKIAILLSFVAIFIGILVSLGWIYNIPALKSVIPNMVTMKFSTSICFVFSGITIYSLARYRQGKTGMAQVAIPISGLVILLFMLNLLFSAIFTLDAGIRNIFIKEEMGATASVLSGIPSIPTMINFILIVISGIFALTETRLTRFFPYVGYAVSIIGIISIIGYLANQPALYYYFPNVNTGMALHTSILFTILGIALFLLKEDTKPSSLKSVRIQTKLVFLFLASSIIPLLFVLSLTFSQLESFPNGNSLVVDMVLIGISTAITISIFSFLISRTISRPILNLRDTAQRISNGDVSSKADERTSDEIGDLGKILNQMVDNITKSERLSAIGELAARLAHDIRNPLSIIKANLELIQRYPQESQSEKSEQRISTIFKAVDRIGHQIDNVLDFVRIKSLDVSKSSVLEILSLALNTTPIPESIRVVIPENDLEIECDKKRLVVVFSNLVMNSVQAVEGSGTITVALKEEKDRAIIEIIDTGSGIPQENMLKIFEPLFTTKQTGTGLGLVTCKNIIEQHHGRLSVKNSPTTFTVDLPILQ